MTRPSRRPGARRPGDIKLRDMAHVMAETYCDAGDGERCAVIDHCAISSSDLRRLAAWCERAAAWLEASRGRK